LNYEGAPNETLTIRFTLPNLIRFSGGSSINGVLYDEYSANTFTVTTNGSGTGTLSFVTSANTTSSTFGQKVALFEIIASSSGSTINPASGSNRLLFRYTTPLFGGQSWIGNNVISATTSGDACNNIAYETMYFIDTFSVPPTVGSNVYSGATGTNLVNGDNKWIAITYPTAPSDELGNYNTKYVIQVDASGVITNIQTCP
jgi:hypothetical protein